MTLPWYLWPLVLIPVVAITLTTTATVFKRKSVAGLGFAVLWLAWTAVAVWLGANDVFRQSPGATNLTVPAAVVGGTVLLVLLSRIPAVAAQMAGPTVKLVVPQAYRITGGVFLIAMALGQLPPVFALPAGLGDIAVGAGALAIVFSGHQPSRKTLVWFNILGILDLVVAVGIGALAGLGPAQLIHTSPSTLAVTTLPLALIPTVAVPLVAALHVVSLLRLRDTEPTTDPTTVPIGHQMRGRLQEM
ncbi:MAG TPA: hypothetical protein VFC19_43265 [Candidatus Limnocylindrales bacterium]|nr:hypothetical protein [Candidatus Limnocylindrales bacterium]